MELFDIVIQFERLSRLIFQVSTTVLIALAFEMALLAVFGAVRVREMLGPAYYPAHMLPFFLGTPSVANVVVLRPQAKRMRGWSSAVPLCTIMALALVLMQYGVSEALYGIDGHGGRFCGDLLSFC